MLRGTVHHPSADEVYHQVRQCIPNISLGTVYRNLERLVQDKVIRKIVNTQGQGRFDANIIPHGHFRCVKCHLVEDLPFEVTFTAIPENSSWYRAREICEVHYEVTGICPVCKSKSQLAPP